MILKKQKEELKKLFELGVMKESPCFFCGYNGKGYYQPENHKCAEMHHKLFKLNGEK